MAKNIGLITTFWHKKHLDEMADEARKVATDNGLKIKKHVRVPGAYEIPLALKRMISSKEIKGVVVLAIIERGETKHGMVMGIAVHRAILSIELETNKPVGLAILGPEILPHQIPKRARLYARHAVEALKEML